MWHPEQEAAAAATAAGTEAAEALVLDDGGSGFIGFRSYEIRDLGFSGRDLEFRV